MYGRVILAAGSGSAHEGHIPAGLQVLGLLIIGILVMNEMLFDVCCRCSLCNQFQAPAVSVSFIIHLLFDWGIQCVMVFV